MQTATSSASGETRPGQVEWLCGKNPRRIGGLKLWQAGHRILDMKMSFRLPSAFALALLFLLIQPCNAQHRSLKDTLVLTDVNVVDVRSGEVRADQTVIIVKNRITTVGPRKQTHYPRNALAINGRGAFLIPGLWDMHVTGFHWRNRLPCRFLSRTESPACGIWAANSIPSRAGATKSKRDA